MAGFTAGCFGVAYVLGAATMAGTDRESRLEEQLRARQTMDHKVTELWAWVRVRISIKVRVGIRVGYSTGA